MIRPLLLVSLIATPSLSDEIWQTAFGEAVYLTERDGAAIFTFPHPDGGEATLWIPGLAGNYDNRSVHEAVWVGTGPGTCPTAMRLHLEGAEAQDRWGRAVLSFDGPAFPTSWTLTLGDCFGPLDDSLRGLAP